MYLDHEDSTKNQVHKEDSETLYFLIALNFWSFLIYSLVAAFALFCAFIGFCYKSLVECVKSKIANSQEKRQSKKDLKAREALIVGNDEFL